MSKSKKNKAEAKNLKTPTDNQWTNDNANPAPQNKQDKQGNK